MMRFGGGFAPHAARGFGYGPGPGAFIAPIVCFLFLAGLVALLVVAMVRARHGHGHSHMASVATVPAVAAPVDQAAVIVRERLARGEIDSQEYERLMNALSGPR